MNYFECPKIICCLVLLWMHILNNCSKQYIIAQTIFSTALQSVYGILFFQNSLSKASGLLFIFIHISMGHISII